MRQLPDDLADYLVEALKKALADYQAGVRAPASIGESRYMGVREVARLIGRTDKAVYHMVSRRIIPFIKRGRTLYFDRHAIATWMKKGTITSGR